MEGGGLFVGIGLKLRMDPDDKDGSHCVGQTGLLHESTCTLPNPKVTTQNPPGTQASTQLRDIFVLNSTNTVLYVKDESSSDRCLISLSPSSEVRCSMGQEHTRWPIING